MLKDTHAINCNKQTSRTSATNDGDGFMYPYAFKGGVGMYVSHPGVFIAMW